MVEAIVGAIIGAVIGGLLTYWATKKVSAQQHTETTKQIQNERLWQTIATTTPILADILNSHTAARVKSNREYLRKLSSQWERYYKIMTMQSGNRIANEIMRSTRGYLDALEQYARGAISESELGRLRVQVRDEISTVVNNYQVNE